MMFNMYYNRSHYLGCTVVKEMPSAVNAISNYVIAKYRANVQNLKVVETKILSPEENMPAPPGMSGHGATALVRLEYELNGKAYEENFYGRRSAIEDPQNLAIMWFISDCYAFRTPKGKVADNLDLFQTMVHSFEINKVWYDVFLKISEYMTKAEKASIDATMEQFRIRVAADAHISAIHRQMYEDNQKAQERINEKFDDNIRGVEPYSDPSTGEKVKLPIGHDHVFYNGASGTYLLSDDANATKNLKGNWTEWNRSH